MRRMPGGAQGLVVVAGALAALWVAQSGCGRGGQTSGALGPRGGELCMEDKRVCLKVPPGALEQEVSFSISVSDEPAPGALGDTFEIGPAGTKFIEPAQVRIRYDLIAEAAELNPALLRIYTEEDSQWAPLTDPQLDRLWNTVNGDVLHLSRFAVRRIDLLEDGGVPPPIDSGVADASVWPDAGRPDAGRPDAGTDAGVDAGRPDAGQPDAGTPDAGQPDAGTPDAGQPDAGTPDAGQPDAGQPDAGELDAGEVDAGEVDAGEVDAGEVDAGEDAGLEDAGEPDGG